ncbi:MAG: dockerin type I domain-containing protein [Chloroflexota bacterium]
MYRERHRGSSYTRHSVLYVMLLSATLLLQVSGTAEAQSSIFDETTSGDLSDSNTAPSGPFLLNEGSNIVIADQQGNPRDVDYLTIIIPAGFEWTGLFLDAYVAGTGNRAFIGLQAGSTFTTDFNNTSATDLLGGLTYGSTQVGTDILDDMGTLGGAQGFTPPLGAGTYTLWLNQTGPNSQATLNIVIQSAVDVDVNDDGLVSPSDVVFVLNRIGAQPTGLAEPADVDGDGDIDQTDANTVIAQIGQDVAP